METFENLDNMYVESVSNSWLDLIKEELDNSNDQIFSRSRCDIDTDPNIIVLSDINETQDITLFEYQISVINFLKTNAPKLCDPNALTNFNDKLEWILKCSKFLAKKTNLNLILHKNTSFDTQNIPRSSYKFCNYNYQCEYNYNIKKHSGCYAQHYVHNLVYADLLSLKLILNKYENSINEKLINETQTTLNTISFVINHMYEELKNSGLNHINRTPKNKKNKKTKN